MSDFAVMPYSDYKDICDSVRAKTGGTETLKSGEIKPLIDGIQAGGGNDWYDTFWDAYQNNGKRKHFMNAFSGTGWTEVSFKPKYDLIIENGSSTFHMAAINGSLIKILDDLGVRFDTSGNKRFESMFSYSSFTEIPAIDLSQATHITQLFTGCQNLKNISVTNYPSTLAHSSAFSNLPALTNLSITGTIAKNFAVAGSPLLTDESVQGILDCLADLTGGTAQTLTLHADVGAKLTDAQKATASAKNWTIIY